MHAEIQPSAVAKGLFVTVCDGSDFFSFFHLSSLYITDNIIMKY